MARPQCSRIRRVGDEASDSDVKVSVVGADVPGSLMQRAEMLSISWNDGLGLCLS